VPGCRGKSVRAGPASASPGALILVHPKGEVLLLPEA